MNKFEELYTWDTPFNKSPEVIQHIFENLPLELLEVKLYSGWKYVEALNYWQTYRLKRPRSYKKMRRVHKDSSGYFYDNVVITKDTPRVGLVYYSPGNKKYFVKTGEGFYEAEFVNGDISWDAGDRYNSITFSLYPPELEYILL